MADAAPEAADRPSRLTDGEVWDAVEHTLLDLVLPALPVDAEWPRAATVQLIGLVRYARHRGADRAVDRTGELAGVLGRLAGNPLVTWDGRSTAVSVHAAAGDALAAAVGQAGPDADAVRAKLRPVLVRQLDDELAETAPLVAAFRGKLDD